MTIRFIHVRNIDDPETRSTSLKGWKTIAFTLGENGMLKYAVATCGQKYNFNRRLGCIVSKGKLLCTRNKSRAQHIRYIVLQEKENYYDALRRVGEL